MVSYHVNIHGSVQGVWYRASTMVKAEELGVKGWIRNKADETVEGVFQGDVASVDALIAWCYKGPSSARVTHIEKKTYRGKQYDSFQIT